MTRETVDFGIDLGTTNSAIAVAHGSDADIVRNNQRREFTPSAVSLSGSGKIRVGEKARDLNDPLNAHTEFKLQMGVRDAYRTFEAAGRRMTPEELSAEVLKSLRQDVSRELREEIGAAVITVPAAFELDQCDATRRAAALAGLEFAPLLQEPTAAAWAYGAMATDIPRRGFWLVYDLGGGTFDAAVISVQDGEFTVVNHAGDNTLGGKRIDWALVEDVLIPAARAHPSLASLDQSDPRHRANIAKLKLAAEEAKIELSHSAATEVDLELVDADHHRIAFEHEITRADLERAALPHYRRSIELCRTALSEKGLAPGDIERVLLVGGATLAPGLRALLADTEAGLGIRLDRSLDPVTVVARGAAIFARTQRLPHEFTRRAAEARGDTGDVLLEFAHKPTGQSTEPLVGGRARASTGDAAEGGTERDWTGYTIEFVNRDEGRLEWRSGKIPLASGGGFTARLKARTSENVYTVELRDAHGTLVPATPDRTTYQLMDHEVGSAPMSHSLGVWVEGNEVAWLVRKGSELPSTGRVILETTVGVRRGQGGAGLIRVPIVQGERLRADRNVMIGQLEVRPDEIMRDVPVRSEVEVSVEIDESFAVRADVYIPILDEEFEIEVDFGRRTPDMAELREQRDRVFGQYQELREEASTWRAERAGTVLDDFDRQGGFEGIGRELESAQVNPDGPATCQELLRRAESTLDEAEEALELPRLVAKAETSRDWARDVLDENPDHADATDRRELREAERKLDAAIAARDATLVEHHREVVRNIGLRVLDATDRLPVLRFMYFKEDVAEGSADPQVQRLLRRGDEALAEGDIKELRDVVNTLLQLMPADEVTASDGIVATTVGRQR